MAKKILIITASLRENSNSDALAKAFALGAEESGNEVETVSLKGKTINYCKGCLACQLTQKCVIQDDCTELNEKMKQADVLVFATPVYYYGLSGLLKTVLDRANPIYPAEFNFREVYLLASAADDSDTTMNGPICGINGWISCFKGVKLAGTVLAGGINFTGEIKGHKALGEAEEMGRRVR